MNILAPLSIRSDAEVHVIDGLQNAGLLATTAQAVVGFFGCIS